MLWFRQSSNLFTEDLIGACGKAPLLLSLMWFGKLSCIFTLAVFKPNVCFHCSSWAEKVPLVPRVPHRSVFIYRVQDLRELGELSPHWDNLRKEVMTRYGGIISSYQETLAELDKITGMSSSSIHSCVFLNDSIVEMHTHAMAFTPDVYKHTWFPNSVIRVCVCVLAFGFLLTLHLSGICTLLAQYLKLFSSLRSCFVLELFRKPCPQKIQRQGIVPLWKAGITCDNLQAG